MRTGMDLSLGYSFDPCDATSRANARYHACLIPRFTSILMSCKYVVSTPRDTSRRDACLKDFRICKQRETGRDVQVDDRHCRRNDDVPIYLALRAS